MTNLEILNKKLENTDSKYDDLLNQFNDDVAGIDKDRAKIVAQIDTETERIIGTNLIGKCFTYKYKEQSEYIGVTNPYIKIYDVTIIPNTYVFIKAIIVNADRIGKIETNFNPKFYTEIPVTEFDTYLSQTLSNLIQVGDLNKYDMMHIL